MNTKTSRTQKLVARLLLILFLLESCHTNSIHLSPQAEKEMNNSQVESVQAINLEPVTLRELASNKSVELLASKSLEEIDNILNQTKSGDGQINFPSELAVELKQVINLKKNELLTYIPVQEIQYGDTLGWGATGIVYEATYQEKKVAAKKLHAHLVANEAVLSNSLKEATIIANHPHENIIGFIGFCPEENALVMEYIPGGSLWSKLKISEKDKISNLDKISWPQRYQIALDVAKGMNYLHKHGIVHCDLKSENILLDNHLRAKVTDFGTAALKTENSTYGVWAGGTLRWMAPELFLKDKNTEAADVYSYGMLLWQLGTGRQPFSEISGLPLIDYIKARKYETISEDTPSQIREVIELCWLPEQPPFLRQRPSMEQVLQKLEASHPTFLKEDKIKRVEKFIEEAARNAEKAKGEDIVLVLGNTGAGKSTCVNYFLGSELETVDTEEGEVIAKTKDPQKEWAKMGHGSTSKTFFPDVYSNPASPFVYCDCPGFNDTRSNEEKLDTTIATQLIINTANNICAIIVVIDVEDLYHERGNSIRNISTILGQLLKGNIEPNSILFVFNNRGSRRIKMDNIHVKVKALEQSESEKLTKLISIQEEDKHTQQEYDDTSKILRMLKMLSTNKSNVFLVNLFDDFKSKQHLEDRLHKLQPTPKDNFSFSTYDNTRVKFNEQLAEVVCDISSNLRAFVQSSENIRRNNERIESCKKQTKSVLS